MYLNKIRTVSPLAAGEIDLASTGVVQYFVLSDSAKVTRCIAMVSTALVSTGAVVLSFYQRPTHGSTSGEVLIATLTVPAATAVGSSLYKDVAGVTVQAGQEVVVKVVTAATTSGKCILNFVGDEAPEIAANLSKLTLSA